MKIACTQLTMVLLLPKFVKRIMNLLYVRVAVAHRQYFSISVSHFMVITHNSWRSGSALESTLQNFSNLQHKAYLCADSVTLVA